ncbi:MAG: chromate transporter [Ruminococcaceae bacterium]|nr:chromate transporter [Oscillospiraceae bacterium]
MIFLELFYTFFKIGLFTFGGGYAMIPLIQSEVLSRGWSTSEELINFIAVAESTPGPFAINIATYVGAEQGNELYGVLGRPLGSACATLGVVMPSFIIILIVARFYLKFKNNKYIAGAMSGLRPAAIALIMSAVVSMASSVFFPAGVSLGVFASYEFITSAVIFAIMLTLMLTVKKLHPILLVGLSAALGVAAGYAERLFI